MNDRTSTPPPPSSDLPLPRARTHALDCDMGEDCSCGGFEIDLTEEDE